jgi:hypothetical protein
VVRLVRTGGLTERAMRMLHQATKLFLGAYDRAVT